VTGRVPESPPDIAMADQMILELGYRPALGMDDFLVARSNLDAVRLLDRWPDWPGPALALVGPPGSGKSHLAHVFTGRSGGAIVAARDIARQDPPELTAHAATLVVEDGDRGVAEESLLHLYNWIAETGRQLLLTSRTAPARWPVALPDLRSRLAALPVAILRAPDDELIAGVLVKIFSDRQLAVGQDVVRFVVPRIERSFAALHAFVAGLDARSLAERRNITVPLAREVLAGLAEKGEEG